MGNCYSIFLNYCPENLSCYSEAFADDDVQFAVTRSVASYVWHNICSWAFSAVVVVPPNVITGGGTYSVDFAVGTDDGTNPTCIGANGIPINDPNSIGYSPQTGYNYEAIIEACGQIFGTDKETGGTIGIARKWALRPYSPGEGSGSPLEPDMGGNDWIATLDVNYTDGVNNFTIFATGVETAPTSAVPGMQFIVECGISVTDYSQEPPAGIIVGSCVGTLTPGGNRSLRGWTYWPYYTDPAPPPAGDPASLGQNIGVSNPTWETTSGKFLNPH